MPSIIRTLSSAALRGPVSGRERGKGRDGMKRSGPLLTSNPVFRPPVVRENPEIAKSSARLNAL
jgi:hypothetical protein